MLWAGQSQPVCNSIGQGSSDLLSVYFALGFAFSSTKYSWLCGFVVVANGS